MMDNMAERAKNCTYGNPDLVRVKVKTDYTWPERFILWWNNVELDKDGVFKV